MPRGKGRERTRVEYLLYVMDLQCFPTCALELKELLCHVPLLLNHLVKTAVPFVLSSYFSTCLITFHLTCNR